MQLNGQHFSQETITAIQATVDAEPEISRRALSRRVCGWLDWRSPNGKLNEAGCRKALLTLHRRGLVHLPEATIPSGLQRPPRSGGNKKHVPNSYSSCSCGVNSGSKPTS